MGVGAGAGPGQHGVSSLLRDLVIPLLGLGLSVPTWKVRVSSDSLWLWPCAARVLEMDGVNHLVSSHIDWALLCGLGSSHRQVWMAWLGSWVAGALGLLDPALGSLCLGALILA